MKNLTDKIEINVSSREFQEGYETGSDHPAFFIGNTL